MRKQHIQEGFHFRHFYVFCNNEKENYSEREKKRKELTELVCMSTCAKPSVMVTQEHMDSGRGERSGL